MKKERRVKTSHGSSVGTESKLYSYWYVYYINNNEKLFRGRNFKRVIIIKTVEFLRGYDLPGRIIYLARKTFA